MSEAVLLLLSFLLVFMVGIGCLVILFRILTSQLFIQLSVAVAALFLVGLVLAAFLGG